MAREDFCFTYYDGDAARDKAHMTRLQRGAYDDIISAQRKRGHLSLDDIKRVLSKDFEECWPAMEWILKIDAEQKFFIEWVDKSLAISRENSERQRKRKQEWWDKKNKEQNDTTVKPRLDSGTGAVEPKEYEIEIGIGIEKDLGKCENPLQIFNAEETILANQILYESICINTQSDIHTARDELRGYHLWLVKEDKYPMKKKQIFAGFEKWLRDRHKFSSNGKDGKHKPKPGSTAAAAEWLKRGRN